MDGKVKSTKFHRPLVLKYYEAYDSEILARKREQTLKKSRSATKALLSRLTI
jgi:predicted GIY-YIG superfamily endonuclease